MKSINSIILSFAVCAIILCGMQTIMAQKHLSPQWLKHSTGEQWDRVSHMVSDTAGNLFIVGNFSESPKETRTSKPGFSHRDILISSYDGEGQVNWKHVITSDGYSHVSSIANSSVGDFYICGYFNGKFTLGIDTLYAPDKSALFIARIDSYGAISWVKQINGDFRGRKTLINSGTGFSLVIAMTFNGNLDLDDFVFEGGPGSDILLAVFDATGQLSNTLHIEGAGSDEINEILIHNSHLFLAGSFEGSLILGDTLISKGRKDAFFVKFDNDLKTILCKQAGNTYDDYGISVKIDHDENIIFSGSHTDTLVFSKDLKLKPYGSLDVFVSKYDSQGKLLWADNFGGKAGDVLSDAAINSWNDIYLTGNFRGDIKKGDSEIKSKKFSNDVFIAKYKNDGSFRYIESAGDTNTDYSKKLIIDDENYLFLTGNFNNTFEVFGMKPDSVNGREFYITKLFDCDNSQLVELPADTSLCAESYIIVADSGFAEYLWNGSSGGFKYKVDTAGLYKLKAVDRHKCISRDTIFVQLKPLPDVDLGDDLIVGQGETVTLFADAGFEAYLWNTNDTISFLEIDTKELRPGEYIFEVVVTDTNLCKNSDEVLLEVVGPEEEGDIKINAFPNPANDKLLLMITNLEPDSKLDIRLYDTNGNLVWSSIQRTTGVSFEEQFEVADLENGTYYLRVKHNKKVNVLKIVKL